VRTADNFLVTSHLQPDGDAIGAMSAMGWILASLGKKFVLYNQSGLPKRFAWLDLPVPIVQNLENHSAENIFILDCGDRDRAGKPVQGIMGSGYTVNIDHHPGNPMFGDLNWVDPTVSSVGEMIGLLAQGMDIPLKHGLGQGVFLAIVSDTGSFSYGNTAAGTLRMAAEILQQGLDLNEFTAKMERQASLGKIRLQGEVLRGTELLCRGKAAMICISRRDLEATGTGPADCEGLVNQIRTIQGVRVAVSLREDEPQKIKFSLRSWGEVDVRQLAAGFGGGGHKNASGGAIFAPLAQAREAMTRALARTLLD
jgi:phosphoesterase RecJ-like protein